MNRPKGQYRWTLIRHDACLLKSTIQLTRPDKESFVSDLDEAIRQADILAAHLRQVRDEIKEGENAET